MNVNFIPHSHLSESNESIKIPLNSKNLVIKGFIAQSSQGNQIFYVGRKEIFTGNELFSK